MQITLADDGTLFVENATFQIPQTFKCTARNDAGTDEKEYTVRTISKFIIFVSQNYSKHIGILCEKLLNFFFLL